MRKDNVQNKKPVTLLNFLSAKQEVFDIGVVQKHVNGILFGNRKINYIIYWGLFDLWGLFERKYGIFVYKYCSSDSAMNKRKLTSTKKCMLSLNHSK